MTAASCPSQRLPRRRILRGRSLFQQTRRKGIRVSNRELMLIAWKPEQELKEEPMVAGFVTPKRIGKAVIRNRVRRRMREVYRRLQEWPDFFRSIIWVSKPLTCELTFQELQVSMVDLMERLIKKQQKKQKKSH